MIDRKRLGGEIAPADIAWLVEAYLANEIGEEQMAAFLMAVCLRGLSLEETTALTLSMVESGDTVGMGERFVHSADKHSTGGVGDKTTMVAVPIAIACGAKVLKLSGGALGHTGGTVDKLRSIPGMRTDLSLTKLVGQLAEIGGALAAHSGNLVPGDRRIYNLRDRTATVESPYLIAASIMAKKLAVGATGIVIDVKFGSGAFIKGFEEAERLARIMMAIGRKFDKKVTCLVTRHTAPLGRAVGNALEVSEAVNVLNGEGPADVADLSVAIAAEMLLAAGVSGDKKNALSAATTALGDGSAWRVFANLVDKQGGDLSGFGAGGESAARQTPAAEIVSPGSGFLSFGDAALVGRAARVLAETDGSEGLSFDPWAGIVLDKTAGDVVVEGERIARLFGGTEGSSRDAEELVRNAIVVGPTNVGIPANEVREVLRV